MLGYVIVLGLCCYVQKVGQRPSKIALELRLHETRIKRDIDDYLNKAKLATQNGGSQSYLSAEQTANHSTFIEENLKPYV